MGVTKVARLTPRRRRTTTLAAALAVPYLGALAFFGVQLRPASASTSTSIDLVGGAATSALSFRWLTDGGVPWVWAVALFVPVGVFAYLVLPRWAWPISLLVGPVLSVILELTQWAATPGHSADPLDMLCNSIGATLGVAIAALVTWWAARAQPLSPITPPHTSFPPLPKALERTS